MKKINLLIIIPLILTAILIMNTTYAIFSKNINIAKMISLKSGSKYIGIYGDNKNNIELGKTYTFTIENRGIEASGFEIYLSSNQSNTIPLTAISYSITGDITASGTLNSNAILINTSLGKGDKITVNILLTTTSNDIFNGKINLRYKDYTLVKNYDYTGGSQTFTAPITGTYKLETWGAQGGSINTTYYGGYGGYSTGNYSIKKSSILYVIIGGKGSGTTVAGTSLSGGYNGGGKVIGSTSVNHIYGSGGGATHIATSSGLLSALSNNKSAILIVAGGGGGARDQANHVTAARWGQGGSGGGYIGGGAVSSYNSTTAYTVLTQNSGTQTSGSAFGKSTDTSLNAGGGGGYYGGYGGSSDAPVYAGCGSGGSGYIGNTALTDKKMYCYNCIQSTSSETYTISTTNHSQTATSNYAKVGNGYARITFVK